MAKLSTAQRKRLPASEFAGPNRSFPVNDKNHAVFAKAIATRQQKQGKLTPASAARIKAKANALLGGK